MQITPTMQARVIYALLRSKPGLTERWDGLLSDRQKFGPILDILAPGAKEVSLLNVIEGVVQRTSSGEPAVNQLRVLANMARKPSGRALVKTGMTVLTNTAPGFRDLLTDTLNQGVESGVLPEPGVDESLDDYLLDKILAKYTTDPSLEGGNICRCPHCSNFFHIA